MKFEPIVCSYSILVGERVVAHNFVRALPDSTHSDMIYVESKTETFNIPELGVLRDRRYTRFGYRFDGGLQDAIFDSERFGSRTIPFGSRQPSEAEESEPNRADWIVENNGIGLFELSIRLMNQAKATRWNLLCTDDGSRIELAIIGAPDSDVLQTNLGFVSDLKESFAISFPGPMVSVQRDCQPFPDWLPLVNVGASSPAVSGLPSIVEEEVVLDSAAFVSSAIVCSRKDGPVACCGLLIGGSGIHDKDGRSGDVRIGYDYWARELTTIGMTSIRFDRYSEDESYPNRPDALGFDDAVQQAGAVLDYLKNRAGGLPLILVGHSLGALIAVSLAATRDDISACCLLSASTQSLRDTIREQSRMLAQSISTRDDHRNAVLTTTEELLASQPEGSAGMTCLSREALDLKIGDVPIRPGTEYIIVHGELDQQVPLREAHKLLHLLQAKNVSVQAKILKGRDHCFRSPRPSDVTLSGAEEDNYCREAAKGLVAAMNESLLARASLSSNQESS